MPKSKKSTKKRNRRESYEYPAIEKSVNLKSRQEEIEDIASYFHTLPPEAKDWLNRYTEESVNANFNHGGEIIHKKRKQKKECFDRNNARNRCILTQEKAKGTIVNYEKIEDLEKMDIDVFSKPVKEKNKKEWLF